MVTKDLEDVIICIKGSYFSKINAIFLTSIGTYLSRYASFKKNQ